MVRGCRGGTRRAQKRGSKYWYLRYYCGMVDGKPKYREESLKTTSQDRAERLRAQRQGQAEQGNLPEPRVKRTRFEDLRKHLLQRAELDGLKSIERIKDAISHLQTIFGTDRASAITVSRIQEYAHRRLTKEKAARASVNYELAILRRIFSLGRAAGLVVGGPKITLTRPPNARTGFFEDGDFQALKAQLPDELVAPAMFAYLTGWRFQSEVLPLTWRQVDFKAGEVRPYTSKNKEGRVFPFSALPALKKLLEEQRDLTSGLVSARARIFRSCSIATASASRTSGARGRPLAKRRASPVGCRTTSAVRRCVVSNTQASLGRWRCS